MILLSFVMLVLNSVFSPIQQARYIDVSISEFQKTLKIFSSCDVSWCFFYHFMDMQTEAIAKWERKKAYSWFITKHNTHELLTRPLSPIWNNTKQYERFQICGDLKITFAKRKDDANIYKNSIFQ